MGGTLAKLHVILPSPPQAIEGMSTNEFMLQQELEYSNKELLQAREMIHEMRKRERELTDRLSEQAQRHLQDSEKFEDILLGASRPTMVVQRYQELYSQVGYMGCKIHCGQSLVM